MMTKRLANEHEDGPEGLLRLGGSVCVAELKETMESAGGDPVSAGSIADLATFWLDLRRRSPQPGRTDFGPEDLKFVLPDLFMVDIGCDGGLRYRLVGTRLAGRFGRDPTGRRIECGGGAWGREAIVTVLRRIVETREPHAVFAEASGDWSAYRLFQAVAMPLHAPDGRVAIVLGAAQFLAGLPGATARTSRLDMRPIR
ncbi:hypothetical protein CVT23_12910 [Minwuia thermotolerans]|uniref:PAS domain-containing protein n=2 Tax=Minwuia thermotolerans TaxID=2056226 RepID=A0A2M9G0Q4_9PROT|nr:hypothetical protein CVT23_12910 [Minwuia thermotolerans]